jgi:NTE family protein
MSTVDPCTPMSGQPVNLALQGGGAHGAFTWGVLDRLLEDDRLSIEAISGTSAGAMNAALVANGMVVDGRAGARAALHYFWESVSKAARHSPFQRTWYDMLTGNWNLDHSPALLIAEIVQRLTSPYQFNPLDINPLRDIVDHCIDFDAVRACENLRVFVTATNVRTGKPRVFRHDELTLDAVMASACLPFMFKAVEIDGDPYWDGGYMGNPAIWPLIYDSVSRDIILVQINPMERPGTPTTAREILNRMNEIVFNGNLVREMRAIHFVTDLIDQGKLNSNEYKRLLFHIISAEEELRPLSASSKLNAEWAFLTHLRDIGRQTASTWLDSHAGQVGLASTVDIAARFL